MLQNNNAYLLKESSILIDQDGFSFCSLTQQHHFKFPNGEVTQETIQTWLNYHTIAPKHCTLVYFDHPAMLVPDPIFDKEKKESYFQAAVATDFSQHAIGHQALQNNDQHLLYPVRKDIQHCFAQLLPHAKSAHGIEVLLPILNEETKGKARKQLFVHLRKGAFELFLFQGSQLLLQNSFPKNNEDEFLYYLFYVVEQFYLQPEHFDLVFLGQYTPYRNYYQAVEKFHPSISTIGSAFAHEVDGHPAPFFQSLLTP